MSVNAFIKVDKATFFKFAQSHEGRSEYVRGRIMMQAGGTRGHWHIAKRIIQILDRQLDSALWLAGGSDLAVDTGETVRYPDVIVDTVGADPNSLTAQHPVLLVEVLSPSSEERDLETKPEEYLALATLQAYIVASQDEAACLVWLRGADGAFPAEPLTVKGHAGVIRVAALSVEISLGDVYRGIC
jgi:Uma2 family endonuclease